MAPISKLGHRTKGRLLTYLGLRCLAVILDFVVMAIPVAVVVSFYSVFRKMPVEFLKLHPGESPAEVTEKLGAHFLYFLLAGYTLANWLYFAISESSKLQATPGKRLCGLFVADYTHQRMTFGRASARYFSGRPWVHIPVIGWLYLILDFAFAAISTKNQSIHDRIAGCLVLRREEID